MNCSTSISGKILIGFNLLLSSTTITFSQGNLTPDSAPAPSMHSLEETWQQIEAQESQLASNEAKLAKLQTTNQLLQSEIHNLQLENNALLEASGVRLPWMITVVDAENNVGKYASLAYSPDGLPAIAYYDDSSDDLKYASFDGQQWTIELLDAADRVGSYCSLGFSPNTGQPCIAYYKTNSDGDRGWLMFIERDANTQAWKTPVVVNGTTLIGKYASLAFTPDGEPAISYIAAKYNNLKYAERNGSEWMLSVIAPGTTSDDEWCDTSLAFSPTGFPAIAYYRGTDHNLYYAWKTESGWVTEAVDTDPSLNIGTSLSLAFSPEGYPSISYDESTSHYLKFAIKSNGSWTRSLIDNTADVGYNNSLAYSPTGFPVVSYFNSTTDDLILATYDGSTWKPETVDSDDDTGRHTSLKFDAFGQPTIAYYSLTQQCLKFAHPSSYSK